MHLLGFFLLWTSFVRKAFADNLNVAQCCNLSFDRVENIKGKEAFSPFSTMFSKVLFPRAVKSHLPENKMPKLTAFANNKFIFYSK